jgi:PAS domain S-box-containing protein
MGYLFGSAGPFVTFYPAVIITILVFGYGPGLLTIVLSGLTADFLFMKPVGSLRLGESGDIAGLVTFCLSGVLLILIALKLREAENERRRNLRFFQNMDRINRAMQGTNDLEQMMGGVLDAMLSIFDCDRALLLYPCDPEAPSFEVMMERTRPEYPVQKSVIPMHPNAAGNFRLYLAASGAVTVGPGCDHPLEMSRFGQKSQIMVALYPKTDKPWVLGIHQCSYPRVWTPDEKKLLEEIARRMTDALTSLLAHRDLRESEERHRVTLKTAMDGFFRTDMQGRILEVNETYGRMTGYSEQELLTMNVADISVVRTAETIAGDIRRLADSGPERFESVHRRKGGSLFDVEISGQYQPIAGGQIVVFVRDITERKRAEETLRQSEAYLAEAQRLSHTGSWAFDVASDKYVYVSEECSRIFESEGLPPREAVSRLIRPKDWESVNGSYEKSLREKVDTRSEFRITLPSGTVKHIHVIRHPVLNSAGDVVQLVGTTMDITERKRAEDALRRSEAYLTEAQRLSHAGNWALDVAGDKHIYYSDEALRIWGFDPHEGLPTKEAVYRRIHPEDQQRWAENLERSLREKVDTFGEYRIVLPDGTVKHLDVIWHPVLDANGDLIQYIGTAADVTERIRNVEALRRSEAYLAATQRLSHTGSWVWDPTHYKFLYASEEMLRLYGFDPQEGIPTPAQVLERIHPDDRDKIKWTRTGNADVDFDYKFVLPDGTLRHFHCIAHPVLGPNGEVREVLGIAMDVTDRKRAEEALRLASVYNRSLIEASLDPLVTIDPEGRISDVNAATEEVTGYTRSELIGTDFSDYFTDPEKARSGYRQVFSEGLVRDYELSIRHRNGDIMPVLYNASIYRDEAGTVIGVFAAARDITERKQAQEALQNLLAELESRVQERTKELSEANESLQAANKELDSFSYSVSHDLRAPLRAIDGFSMMVLKGYADKLDDEGRRKLNVIRSNTQRMGQLIDDLLAFSRMGRKEMLRASIDMEALVHSAWGELSLVHSGRSIQLSVDKLPPAMGDPTLIKEVVLNLLSNAIKFSKQRETAIIEVGAYPEEERNVYFVKDNGVGFDMQYYDKLFGVFRRLHTSDQFEGTGVGLAIADRIIRRHGERVWAEGTVGEGATFYFTLARRQ